MYTHQLQLFDIVGLIAVFSVPGIYLYLRHETRLTLRQVATQLIFGLFLTFCSLAFYGSRGGLPSADVYGWPKEYILVREGVRGYNSFYFLVDIVFYASFIAGLSAAYRLIRK